MTTMDVFEGGRVSGGTAVSAANVFKYDGMSACCYTHILYRTNNTPSSAPISVLAGLICWHYFRVRLFRSYMKDNRLDL
jgi:hypothetical protein